MLAVKGSAGGAAQGAAAMRGPSAVWGAFLVVECADGTAPADVPVVVEVSESDTCRYVKQCIQAAYSIPWTGVELLASCGGSEEDEEVLEDADTVVERVQTMATLPEDPVLPFPRYRCYWRQQSDLVCASLVQVSTSTASASAFGTLGKRGTRSRSRKRSSAGVRSTLECNIDATSDRHVRELFDTLLDQCLSSSRIPRKPRPTVISATACFSGEQAAGDAGGPGDGALPAVTYPSREADAPPPAGELQVLSVHPTPGDTSLIRFVLIEFSESMVELSGTRAMSGTVLTPLAGEERAALVTLTPPVDGTWQWVCDRHLLFVPLEPISHGSVRVDLSENTTSLIGRRLATPFSRTFKSDRIQLLHKFCFPCFADPERTVIVCTFDNAVAAEEFRGKSSLAMVPSDGRADPSTLMGELPFSTDEAMSIVRTASQNDGVVALTPGNAAESKPASIPIAVDVLDSQPDLSLIGRMPLPDDATETQLLELVRNGHMVFLQPKRALPPNEKFQVNLKCGDDEAIFRFSSPTPLSISKSQRKSMCELEIEFSCVMCAQDIASMVHVHPYVPKKVVELHSSRKASTLAIKGLFEPHVSYKVSLSPDITDKYGRSLQQLAGAGDAVHITFPAMEPNTPGYAGLLVHTDDQLLTLTGTSMVDPATEESSAAQYLPLLHDTSASFISTPTPSLSLFSVNYHTCRVTAREVCPTDWHAFVDYAGGKVRRPPGTLVYDETVNFVPYRPQRSTPWGATLTLSLHEAFRASKTNHLLVVVAPAGGGRTGEVEEMNTILSHTLRRLHRRKLELGIGRMTRGSVEALPSALDGAVVWVQWNEGMLLRGWCDDDVIEGSVRSLRTGEPVTGATVRMIGPSSRPKSSEENVGELRNRPRRLSQSDRIEVRSDGTYRAPVGCHYSSEALLCAEFGEASDLPVSSQSFRAAPGIDSEDDSSDADGPEAVPQKEYTIILPRAEFRSSEITQTRGQLRWFTYDAKGVYSGNDTIHIFGWLRVVTEDGTLEAPQSAAKVGYKLKVGGHLFCDGEVKTSEGGAFHLSYRLPSFIDGFREEAVLHFVYREIDIKYEEDLSHEHRFEIHHVSLALINIHMHCDVTQKRMVGDSVRFHAQLMDRTETSLGSWPVSWKVELIQSPMHCRAYPEFKFASSSVSHSNTISATSNSDGASSVDYTLSKFDAFGPIMARATVTVRDHTMKESAHRVDAMYHTSELYVGVRAAGVEGPPCERPGYYTLYFEVIVVNVNGHLVSDASVVVSVQPLGTQAHNGVLSQSVSTLAARYEQGCCVTSSNRPVKCSVALPVAYEISKIRATVSDADGRLNTVEVENLYTNIKNKVSKYWILPQPHTTAPVCSFCIILNKAHYEVGEEAIASIFIPFAPGTLHIECGAVNRQLCFATPIAESLSNNIFEWRFTVSQNMVPNAHLHAWLSRSETPRKGSTFKRRQSLFVVFPRDVYTRTSFCVSRATKQLTVSVPPIAHVDTDSNTLNAEVQVRDSTGKGCEAEVCLFAVQQGVFELSASQALGTEQIMAKMYRPVVNRLEMHSGLAYQQHGTVNVVIEMRHALCLPVPVAIPAVFSRIATVHQMKRFTFSLIKAELWRCCRFSVQGEPLTDDSQLLYQVGVFDGTHIECELVLEKIAGPTAQATSVLSSEFWAYTHSNQSGSGQQPADSAAIATADAVFPMGIFRTRRNGKLKQSLRLPPLPNIYMLQAVACAGGKFGVSDGTPFTSSKPVTIKTIAPSFVHDGDTFEVVVQLENSTTEHRLIHVRAVVLGPSSNTECIRTGTAGPHGTVHARFLWTAPARLSGASQFRAHMACISVSDPVAHGMTHRGPAYSDECSVSIPIRRRSHVASARVSGAVAAGAVNSHRLNLAEDVSGDISVQVHSSWMARFLFLSEQFSKRLPQLPDALCSCSRIFVRYLAPMIRSRKARTAVGADDAVTDEIRTLTNLQDDSGGFRHLGNVGHKACRLVGRESLPVTLDVAFCIHVMMSKMMLPFAAPFLSSLVDYLDCAVSEERDGGLQEGLARITIRAQVAYTFFALTADSAELAVDGDCLALPDRVESLVEELQQQTGEMSCEGLAWYILCLIESEVGDASEVRELCASLLERYEKEKQDGFHFATELSTPCRLAAVCTIALLRAHAARMLEEDFKLTGAVHEAVEGICGEMFAFAGAPVSLRERTACEHAFEMVVAHKYATTTGLNAFAVSQACLGELIEELGEQCEPEMKLAVNGNEVWKGKYERHAKDAPTEVFLPYDGATSPASFTVALGVSMPAEARGTARDAVPYDVLFFAHDPFPRAVAKGVEISRSYSALGVRTKQIQTVGDTVSISCGSPVVVTLTVTNYEPLRHVAVVDELPAGLQAPPEPPFPRPMYPMHSDRIQKDPLGDVMSRARVFDHRDVGLEQGWHMSHLWGNDRVVSARGAMLFSTLLHPGRHHFSYIAVASSVGEYYAPPATVECMYNRGGRCGHSSGALVKIM